MTTTATTRPTLPALAQATPTTVAWPRGEQAAVTLKGWRDTELAYEDVVYLETTGSVYFDADYRAITTLELSSGNHERIARGSLLSDAR